jgi:co-chaperonin GroES (HSP10)
MAKKVVTPPLSAPLIGGEDFDLSEKRVVKQPAIRAVKPLGGQILVEVFLEEEVSPDSKIILPDISKNKGDRGVGGAPQGRVLDIGPGLSPSFGVKVGDRVLLQGNFVPLPKLSDQRDGDRERALVEPHTIKALLLEEETVSPLLA